MINLDPIFLNDSQLFRVQVYDTTGALLTPLSCACSVFNHVTGATVLSNQAGTVGLGYAQYNWVGSATAGQFDATLTVTLAADVIRTEQFTLAVKANPTIAFTYIGDLATDLDRLRFEIGDIVLGAGVLPDAANIPDATLNALIASEGSWGAAAARACEILARHWAKIAASKSMGPRSEANQQVVNFRQQAQDLRAQYGGGPSLQAGTIALDFAQKGDDLISEG